MKIAIVISQYNKKITDGLLQGARLALQEGGLKPEQVEILEVPGSFEIPFTIQKLTTEKKYAGFIALGCVIKGETDHYEAVCNGVTYGLQKVSIENGTPIMFGVLMCRNIDQALKRSVKGKNNKGYECGRSLLQILRLEHRDL